MWSDHRHSVRHLSKSSFSFKLSDRSMQSQVPQPDTKRFTLEEANAMLPLVRSIAEDIQSVFRDVTGRRTDLHRLLRRRSRSAGSAYEDEVAESRADLQAEYDRIWLYREELESLGVHLRQPEIGAIEFPTIICGQEAFYCWQIGEPRVASWRLADEPWSARKPVRTPEQVN
ncbi:MAG: DUF2203 family protein [Planctomycetota bacterium]|nr:MAG: DUF2203 family protein [Planctomycetota bacterium]